MTSYKQMSAKGWYQMEQAEQQKIYEGKESVCRNVIRSDWGFID